MDRASSHTKTTVFGAVKPACPVWIILKMHPHTHTPAHSTYPDERTCLLGHYTLGSGPAESSLTLTDSLKHTQSLFFTLDFRNWRVLRSLSINTSLIFKFPLHHKQTYTHKHTLSDILVTLTHTQYIYIAYFNASLGEYADYDIGRSYAVARYSYNRLYLVK